MKNRSISTGYFILIRALKLVPLLIAVGTLLSIGPAADLQAASESGPIGGGTPKDVIIKKKTIKPRLHLLKPKLAALNGMIVGTGTIFASKTSNIGPVVAGQLQRVFVNVGDHLESGDPLFEIRPTVYRLRVDESEAELSMAKSKALAARQNLARVEKLSKKQTVSESRLDEARRGFAVARAEVDLALVKLKLAKQNLADTVIRAPYKSVVTARNIDEGVFLSTQTAGGTGSTVVQIKKIDVVTAIVGVPAQELEKLRTGATTTLKISGMAKPVTAKVSVVNDRIDAASRMIEVRMLLANLEYAIKPGLFVFAEIEPATKKAVILPRATVLGLRNGTYIFVLSNGRAEKRLVKVSDFDASHMAVLSGATESDSVIAGPGLRQIQDGQELSGILDVAR